ncbi:hypothetical protein VOLCADRAFT_106417 [Volvox carteri f. nagariensis]|uniref:Peptidase S54 rhomboid domain-containing protein n=1 Tax=Volvox carteri f. nagariensis TaxID=3068 RepID=D8U776_VOLCA|nr:uncharacterized protein VOLCADRAFT_106417 [Volvox carteri f. nagariensis]EFJ44375.1 hypothetical protein VOLCADRAFT_106417 [Volvox carteri f. nagariensis]|eukprot:XP_002954482.1 hypothetical protein VOLCADRAFT_106417 [Volvox carteri f. nagariensis]
MSLNGWSRARQVGEQERARDGTEAGTAVAAPAVAAKGLSGAPILLVATASCQVQRGGGGSGAVGGRPAVAALRLRKSVAAATAEDDDESSRMAGSWQRCCALVAERSEVTLRPQWWQFLTHMFCHGNWAHLSGNLFNLCVFGKMVEETEGALGVVLTFLLCGVGAALATFLATPASNGHVTVSVGASGAIFGLFAVSVATRLRWNLKQLLEAAVLGQFVVRQVLDEARHQVAGGLMMGGMAVSHAAHLAGAAVGVLLVLVLQRLPEPGSSSSSGK